MKTKALKKKKLKSLASVKAKTWKTFSTWVRKTHTINGMVQCYTCGAVDRPENMQAGHAIGGRHNAVLFDLFLVRPQCPKCNVFNRGEYGRFAARLIEEYGLAWYQEKQRLCSKGTSRIVKYSRSDLEEMHEFFKSDF